MENAQKNGTRPPAGGYYTSTNSKIADFLIGFAWLPFLSFFFSWTSNLFSIPDSASYLLTFVFLCLVIFPCVYYYRRGRSFLATGMLIPLILLVSFWIMFYIFFVREPKPIPFDRQVWLHPGTGVRYTMLNDLLLKHRLVGMTRSEAEELLGKPDGRDRYRLKLQGFGLGEKRLELRYKNEKVSGFSIVDD